MKLRIEVFTEHERIELSDDSVEGLVLRIVDCADARELCAYLCDGALEELAQAIAMIQARRKARTE